MNTKANKEEMRQIAAESVSKLYTISEMLSGLQTSLFEDSLDGVLQKNKAHYDGIPAEFTNGFDWMMYNYELTASSIRLVNEVLGVCIENIDNYITSNFSLKDAESIQDAQESTQLDSYDVVKRLYAIQSLATTIYNYDTMQDDAKANIDISQLARMIDEQAADIIKMSDEV